MWKITNFEQCIGWRLYINFRGRWNDELPQANRKISLRMAVSENSKYQILWSLSQWTRRTQGEWFIVGSLKSSNSIYIGTTKCLLCSATSAEISIFHSIRKFCMIVIIGGQDQKYDYVRSIFQLRKMGPKSGWRKRSWDNIRNRFSRLTYFRDLGFAKSVYEYW